MPAGLPDLSIFTPAGTINPASMCSMGPATTFGSAASGTWPAAGLVIFIPFTIDRNATIKRIVTLNGTTAAGSADVGVFDTAGNLIVNKGPTTQTGTSTLQAFDITDTTLSPGNYFIAAISNTATATFNRWAPSGAVVCEAFGVKQMDNSGGTAATLPTSATFAAPTNSYIPVISLDFQGTM